jgi:hypothetical protein
MTVTRRPLETLRDDAHECPTPRAGRVWEGITAPALGLLRVQRVSRACRYEGNVYASAFRQFAELRSR